MLSNLKRLAPASEIAQTLAVPSNYLMKVLAKLRSAGLVCSTLGKNGGYSLQIPAKQITFQMVFDAMGETIKINRCLEPDHYCSRHATQTCPVRAFYTKIQDYLDTEFSKTSVADLQQIGEKKNAR